MKYLTLIPDGATRPEETAGLVKVIPIKTILEAVVPGKSVAVIAIADEKKLRQVGWNPERLMAKAADVTVGDVMPLTPSLVDSLIKEGADPLGPTGLWLESRLIIKELPVEIKDALMLGALPRFGEVPIMEGMLTKAIACSTPVYRKVIDALPWERRALLAAAMMAASAGSESIVSELLEKATTRMPLKPEEESRLKIARSLAPKPS